MSKRLQVVMDDREYLEFQRAAEQDGLTVSEWVRRALREARPQRAGGDAARKLTAVQAASRHAFPSGDIGSMLEEIESGYQQ